MTERELLELAAKAAGIELTWDCTDRLGEPWTVIKGVVCAYWNPLTDDGDALRLAVKLRLDTGFEKLHTVCVWSVPLDKWITEQCEIGNGMGKGIEGLTRRAIVRAAAEIGRSMK